jgi:hypothetical protein
MRYQCSPLPRCPPTNGRQTPNQHSFTQLHTPPVKLAHTLCELEEEEAKDNKNRTASTTLAQMHAMFQAGCVQS